MTGHPVSSRRRAAAWLLLAALAASLGCSLNPATGQRQLVLMSEAQEIALGEEYDREIQAEMGLYPDAELQTYVQDLGTRLAARSERPDLPWTFRVLDDPIVNAFALPGGYVYVTRGILTHFNSEAELAAVLGHEIGHVTGRHSAARISTAQLAMAGVLIGALASDSFREYAGLVEIGLGLLFLKFSRNDERQADDLGLRYMTRGEYDPGQMPRVFDTLGRVSDAGGSWRLPAWLSTHPDPGNRAARIAQQIGTLPVESQSGIVNRDAYLARLDNMVFGEDPRAGYAIGNAFYHPELEFQLTFPAGWEVVNQRRSVTALGPGEEAMVVVSLAEERTADEGFDAFFNQDGMVRGDGWRRRFRYFRAAAERSTEEAGQEPEEDLVGLVGFVDHRGRLYQLLGTTASDQWQIYGRPLQQSLASFQSLGDRRYLDAEPQRVTVVQLDRAMSLAEFDRRYPSTVDLPTLAIVNGVEEDERLPAGRRVKRIVGGQLPAS